MSKAALFVTIYSIILISLFIVLCYLMIGINPPPKPDPDGIRRSEDLDYLLTPNDVLLPNDNLAYGLEKVTNDYEDIFEPTAPTNLVTKLKLKPDVIKPMEKHSIKKDTPLWSDRNQKNCTRKQTDDYTFFTKPIKPPKDLRRSINEESQQEYQTEMPRSLLLKIKGVDGHPQIEIKVVPEKLKNRRTRKYRSFGTKLKSASNSSSKINYFGTDEKSIKEASIVMAENGTFILNIYANSIDIIDQNETVVSYIFQHFKENNSFTNLSQEMSTQSWTMDNPNLTMYDPDSGLLSIDAISTTNAYKVNLMNNNLSQTNFIMESYTDDNDSNILSPTKQGKTDVISNKSIINDKHAQNSTKPLNLQESALNVQFPTKSVTNNLIVENVTLITTLFKKTSHTDIKGVQTLLVTESNADNISSNSLVGLLIPEGTATLPINFHFLNGNWTGLEW